MKKLKNILIIVAALAIAVCATSCTPEEVDAFADGYRQGYYGSYY